MQPYLAIIADDLTGGLDTGVAFATRGWRTVLCFASQSPVVSRQSSVNSSEGRRGGTHDPRPTTDDCDALVWDTETRHADDETARRIVREVCDHPTVRAAPRIYKKIDSTLRGPWLAELQEVWKARAPLTTLLCPAFPAVGRTLVDGELRVHGRSLAEAGFDGTGRLRDLLIEQWGGRVVSVPAPLGEIDGSGWRTDRPPTFQPAPPPLHASRSNPKEDPLLLLADAETDADLDALAAHLHRLNLDDLLCGAGGLAAAWARTLIPEPPPLPPLEPMSGPLWIIAGSQHEATRIQMEALAGTAECHVERIEAHTAGFARRMRGLPGHSTLGLTLTSAPPHLITPSFAAWAAEVISAVAAEARVRGVGAFVATGGETAALLLRAMGASALEIDRELLPGVPRCRIVDGPWAGTPLITKAGGFGEPDALVRAAALMRNAALAGTAPRRPGPQV
jgi:D-threonate/D-erythronate kinase